jgi:hypothetical protein
MLLNKTYFPDTFCLADIAKLSPSFNFSLAWRLWAIPGFGQLYTILVNNIQNYTILYTNTIPNQNNWFQVLNCTKHIKVMKK